MNQPNAAKPDTGTILFQQDTSAIDDNEEEYTALLAALADVQDKHYAVYMRVRTGEVTAECRNAVVQYHKPGKKASLEFKQRYTKRLLQETQRDLGL
jgi:outer membrane lipoprotein-sorting protein